jgi:hypothetical protein
MQTHFSKSFAIVLVLVLFTFSSCEKLFITPDEVGNEPVRNFELFWNDIDKTYPFFTDDKVDWQAIYDKHRPLVNENTSTEKLFSIFASMIEPLMDGHRSLTYNNRNLDLYWAEPPKYRRSDRYNFATLENKYLEDINVLTQPNEFEPSEIDTVLITATIESGKYAYIGIKSYFTEIELYKRIDAFLKSKPFVSGYILDIRNNGGGYLYQMFDVMSLFANRDVPYATYQPKVGPLQTSLMPLDILSGGDFSISFNGYDYRKPMVVVTNRLCFSAAEHTSLAANEMGIPTIGDTTGGALSPITEKTLPNGIQFVLVNSRTLDMRGRLWERIGVPPTVYVKASKQDFASKDPYLDKSIELLETKIARSGGL